MGRAGYRWLRIAAHIVRLLELKKVLVVRANCQLHGSRTFLLSDISSIIAKIIVVLPVESALAKLLFEAQILP